MHVGFKFLRKVVNLPLMRNIFVWSLINLIDFLPIHKISETDALICFHHPQPVYPVHIVLVPKGSIRDLSHIDFERGEFFQDLLMTVRKLVEELKLEEMGYSLILNGGEYQEFPQLHLHLISGDPI